MRWILVVSGLEALVSVGKVNLSAQFRTRVRNLGREFDMKFEEGELRDAYVLRSKVVHAAAFLYSLETVLPKNQQSDLYVRLEALLRATLKRCLLEEEFGDFFRDDAAVQACWSS